MLVLAAFVLLLQNRPLQHGTTGSSAPATALPKALAQPNLFKPLTPDQAVDANASLPFAMRPDSPAHKFLLTADSDSRERAIECLGQAVYYEAGNESLDGRRAVAQVVLNRLRHPGYPSSVCGVVFQGSERVMGCQFTFTCDGSLLRPPNFALFAVARRVAIEALAGHVFAPVGHATNYHANYVLPYWAAFLDKEVQIGRHIFYRLKGGLGAPTAFGQRYAGREPDVVPQATTIVAGQAIAESSQTLSSTVGGALAGRPPNPIIAADAIVHDPIVADSHASALIVDGDTLAKSAKKRSATKNCPDAYTIKLTPVAPNQLRSDAKDAC